MLLQFLLKMFRSFLRRFFVSLKKFLIFSSNWRGDSLKFPTQAWKKSGGAPLGEEGTGLCLQVACQMSLAFLTPVFFFSFAFSLPSPLVCCTMHPEATRYAIYSRIHLAHLCVPGIR